MNPYFFYTSKVFLCEMIKLPPIKLIIQCGQNVFLVTSRLQHKIHPFSQYSPQLQKIKHLTTQHLPSQQVAII